jgi:hypothetical protein
MISRSALDHSETRTPSLMPPFRSGFVALNVHRGEIESLRRAVQIASVIAGSLTTPIARASDSSLYSPLVRVRGSIAFHDIASGRGEFAGGVPGFWSQATQKQQRVCEFMHDWSQRGLGTGFLRKRAPAAGR